MGVVLCSGGTGVSPGTGVSSATGVGVAVGGGVGTAVESAGRADVRDEFTQLYPSFSTTLTSTTTSAIVLRFIQCHLDSSFIVFSGIGSSVLAEWQRSKRK